MIEGALVSGGGSMPDAGTNGADIIEVWIVNYAEGRTRMAYAAAGGDGGNDDGKDLIEDFDELIEKILDKPNRYDDMLNGSASDTATPVQVRGYVLSNADDKTIADGDFDPIFTRDEEY